MCALVQKHACVRIRVHEEVHLHVYAVCICVCVCVHVSLCVLMQFYYVCVFGSGASVVPTSYMWAVQ